jgi:Phage integrase family
VRALEGRSRPSTAAPRRPALVRPAVSEEQEAAGRAHLRRVRLVLRLRSPYLPGTVALPSRGRGCEGEDLQPEDILRRALERAGIVTSYTHVCRRKTCRYAEERGDCELRPCPKCDYKLWPKGNVRHLRFHDLRATYTSAILMLGANLTSVQKLLGHSNPKITERRYGHLLPDFMKSEVDRLRFGLDRLVPRVPQVNARMAPPRAKSSGVSLDVAGDGRRLGTPVVRKGSATQEEAGTPRLLPRKPRHLGWRGVRDSKPLGRSGATCRRGTPFVTKDLWLSGYRVSVQSTSDRARPRESASGLETIWRRAPRSPAAYISSTVGDGRRRALVRSESLVHQALDA